MITIDKKVLEQLLEDACIEGMEIQRQINQHTNIPSKRIKQYVKEQIKELERIGL